MYNQTTPVVQKYGGTSLGDIDLIKSVALRIANHYRQGWHKLAIVVSAQAGETSRLISLLKQLSPEPPTFAYDMAVSAGEQVSVGLLCAALYNEGIMAKPLLAFQLGIITDDYHSRARIKQINSDKIFQAWENKKVAVIAGFQGITSSLEITTLGRGGSDTSAVALAVALKAGFCEINTDVDGVFTANPSIIPEAKLIKTLDYETALEMASLGSKVLHPRSVELAKKYELPLIVRNSFKSNNSQRSIIMNYSKDQLLEAPVVSGISLEKDVAKITIKTSSNSSLSKIFTSISNLGISVDIIVLNQDKDQKDLTFGFTLSNEDEDLVKQTLLNNDDIVTTERGFSKVSIVGVGMHGHPGVAARTFAALNSKDINIHMVSTSEIKISCIVDKDKADDAVKILHQEFFDKK